MSRNYDPMINWAIIYMKNLMKLMLVVICITGTRLRMESIRAYSVVSRVWAGIYLSNLVFTLSSLSCIVWLRSVRVPNLNVDVILGAPIS